MSRSTELDRVTTGVRNFDVISNGGLPRGSATIISGEPGSGKTIFATQVAFHNAGNGVRVLMCNTVSEPTAKSLRNLGRFGFFQADQLTHNLKVVDLGAILLAKGLEEAAALVMKQVKAFKPEIVIIDSFKAFDDLADSNESLRRFGYELIVNLMAWETTVLLLGEYAPDVYAKMPIFSIVDGLIGLSQRESSGENQRFIRIVKMRGTTHSRDEHPFLITPNGLEVFAPRLAIHRVEGPPPTRCRTNITKLDELLGTGILWGSSLLISGAAGTGKTVLMLEFIYRGAVAGEKGILFSFEETEDRLRATAAGLGWDIEREIARGMIEIVFIAQPDILVESDLLMIKERIQKLRAKRVAVDSLSVFLHKLQDAQISREKVFHLCTVVQNAGAVGWFAADIPYGSSRISRLGVEETVVDGVIIVSATEEGFERQRYIEVYKLRNTAHLRGRHSMQIGPGGVAIFPRYGAGNSNDWAPPALDQGDRLDSGVVGLDELLGGGLLRRSVTLVSGSAGSGKTNLGLQFITAGAARGEPGLYVTLEEGPDQLLSDADALGLSLRAGLEGGLVEILFVAREQLSAGQFLTALTDRLERLKAKRLVLDAVTHMVPDRGQLEELRFLLYKLVVRFKTIGVTSLFLIEAPSLYSTDVITDQRLSPVADNLLALRYADEQGQRVPTVTVVKTRGSDHRRSTHTLQVERGGVRVGPALSSLAALDPPAGAAPQRGSVS
jgi:circadian clock protein KaiC